MVHCISRKHVLGTRTAQAPPPLIHAAPVPTSYGWHKRQDISREHV